MRGVTNEFVLSSWSSGSGGLIYYHCTQTPKSSETQALTPGCPFVFFSSGLSSSVAAGCQSLPTLSERAHFEKCDTQVLHVLIWSLSPLPPSLPLDLHLPHKNYLRMARQRLWLTLPSWSTLLLKYMSLLLSLLSGIYLYIQPGTYRPRYFPQSYRQGHVTRMTSPSAEGPALHGLSSQYPQGICICQRHKTNPNVSPKTCEKAVSVD